MASSYIHRTNSGGSGTTATVSFWAKLNQVTADGGLVQFYTDNSNFMGIYANPTVKFRTYISTAYSSGDMVTYIKHRDPGAWYHYVCVFDTTNGVAADRMRLWINGVRVSASEMNSPVNPSSGYSFTPLVSGSFQINRYNGNTTYSDHDYSHIHYCDGYAYDASYFGEFDSTSGIWKIKTSPSVSYGTNGVFLKMEDRTNLDLDSSPNAHTMTTVGTVTPTYDNPSNNFCTMNGIWYGLQSFTLENGNTRITPSSNYGFPGSMAMNKGKWYFEAIPKAASAGIGIVSGSAFSQGYLSDGTYAGGFGSFEGNKAYGYVSTATTQYLLEATTTTESWGAQLNHSTDVLQIALDLDNNFLYFGINGTWQNSGVPTSGSTGTGGIALAVQGAGYPALGEEVWAPFAHSWDTTVPTEFNFGNGYFGTTAVSTSESDDAGEGSFEFDVPAGFYAICTKNIKAYGG